MINSALKVGMTSLMAVQVMMNLISLSLAVAKV